jgi:quercetin dioxygenase-like cupin family protein
MLVTAAAAPRHATPNAVMRTLAAPSLGAVDLAVWEVVMSAGAAGPEHVADREQVWTVLTGMLQVSVDGGVHHVAEGDALRIAAGAARRISAPAGARALVASPAGVSVTTPEGGTRPLPWAV